jgi:hypothetical protein
VGSQQHLKTTKPRQFVGKSLAPLDKKLQDVEWGEYSFDSVFIPLTVRNKLSKENLDSGGKVPVYSSESTNNGIIGYTHNSPDFIVDSKNQVYVIFGDHTRTFSIATKSFCVADNVKVLALVKKLSIRTLLYIVSSWQKCIPNKGYSRHWGVAQEVFFKLPTKNGGVDFDFMESFIAELEMQQIAELDAYLVASNLKDYTLTKEEKKALAQFEDEKIEWGEFTYSSIFNQILQGRRLKKDDQIPGDIPFVMAGVTNTGVVSYISNPVASFPRNSITIDIFGNTFYRNYDFGAGDDTGVYWNDKNQYTKEMMLFCAASMERSLLGKFSYGNKLRSSQSLNLKMKLPANGAQPNYNTMETFISAIQKLVIKDVVLYADQKIGATKKVVENKQVKVF